MDGIIYLALLFFSIAFAVVVIYMSLVLRRVNKTMKVLDSTLSDATKKVEYITPQLQETIRETEKIVDDVEDKLKSTDSIFATVENVGTSVNSLNDYVQSSKDTSSSEQKLAQQAKPFVEGIKWSEVAFILYSKWKKRPKADKNELVIQNNNTAIAPIKQTGGE